MAANDARGTFSEVGLGLPEESARFQEEEEDLEKGRGQSKQEVDEEIFSTPVEQMNGEIADVAKATSDIAKIDEQTQKALTTAKEQELNKKLNRVIDTTNKQAVTAKISLSELTSENEQVKSKNEVTSSDLGVRENLLSNLIQQLFDEMKNYEAAQQKYETNFHRKMKRQSKMVKPDLTDEDVEEIVKSEGGRDALFKQAILAGGLLNDESQTVTTKDAGKCLMS